MTAAPDPYLIDDDNPELTDEQIRAMRPASEILPPALYAKLVARSQARRAAREPVTLRLEPTSSPASAPPAGTGKIALPRCRERRWVVTPKKIDGFYR